MISVPSCLCRSPLRICRPLKCGRLSSYLQRAQNRVTSSSVLSVLSHRVGRSVFRYLQIQVPDSRFVPLCVWIKSPPSVRKSSLENWGAHPWKRFVRIARTFLMCSDFSRLWLDNSASSSQSRPYQGLYYCTSTFTGYDLSMERMLATIPHDRLQSPSEGMDRRSFVKSSLCNVLAAPAITVGVVTELSQPASDNTHFEQTENPVSLETVLSILRTQFPSMRVVTIDSHDDSPPDYKDKNIAPESLTDTARRMLRATLSPPRSSGSEKGLVEYVWNYRLSIKQASQVPKAEWDCNDPMQHACEILYRNGITSYMVSTWANNPEEGTKHWHVFAACKINDRSFVFVDNSGVTTVWEGTLASFVAQYRTNSPGEPPKVRLVALGISEYRESKYENVFSKFGLQIRQVKPDETHMVSVGENPNTFLTSNSSQHR